MAAITTNPSVSQNPNIVYERASSAIVKASSHAELSKWWLKVKNTSPFTSMVAERVTFEVDDARELRLKMKLCPCTEEQEDIGKLFQKYAIPCENLPAPSPTNIREAVLQNLQSVYQIDGCEYKILSLISDRGAYGDVFLAVDLNTTRKVAIKILRVKQDKEDEVLQRMQKAGGHPNIVKYIGSGSIMGKKWIVMEYVEKGMTRDQLETKYPSGAWLGEINKQYQSALEFMAALGVTRACDNERENMLITRTDDGKFELTLVDFGTLGVY